MKKESYCAIKNQENSRLEALQKYHILDTPPEQEYDSVVKLAAHICNAPIAILNFLDNNRQWLKAKTGLDLNEVHFDFAFYTSTLSGADVFEITDTLEHEEFKNHSLVTGHPHVRYFAGLPIKNFEGYILGVLCILDIKPQKLDKEQKDALETLCKQVVFNLEARRAHLEQEKERLKKLELENALLKSQNEVYKILDSITDGFFAVTKLSIVTYWNTEAEKLLSIPRNEIIGKNLWDFFYEAIPLKFYSEYQRAMKENITVHFEEYYPPIKKWFDVIAYPSENGLSVYFKDITRLKSISEKERLSKEVLEMNAVPENSIEHIIFHFLQGLEKLYEGMHLSVLLRKGERLYTIAAPRLPQEFTEAITGLKIGKNRGSCGAAAFLKMQVVTEDIETDKNWAKYNKYALAAGLRSCWSFPIVDSKGKVLGTFAAYFKEIRKPAPHEQATLDGFSRLLSVILENKLAIEELKESIERYNLVAKATNDIIWDWNLATNKIFRSNANLKSLGYRKPEVKATSGFWEYQIHPEDLQRVKHKLKKHIDNPCKAYWEDNYRFRKADGTYAYVYDRGYISRDSTGKPTRMIGAMQDITEKKVSEEELKKLSLIAKETTNAVIITDALGNINWVNEGFTKITEYSFDEAIGKNPGRILQGADTDKETKAYMSRQIKHREAFDCEILNYSKSGKKLWVKIQGQPLFNANGKLEGYFAIEKDVTKQREEEQQLKLLESAITNSYDAILIFQEKIDECPKYNIVYANHSFLKLTGFATSEIHGKIPGIQEGPLSDQDEFSKLETALANSHAYETELVNYKKNGESFWVHTSLIPIWGQEAACTHWILIQRDISLRKKHEKEREILIDELQQTNADLKQFSYITSHNLRAPLSNMMGILNLIDMANITDQENMVLIKKFRESTDHLNKTIEELMEILVLKNTLKIPKEHISISSIFEKVVASVETLLKEAGGTVAVDFSQGDRVSFNSGYLNSILLNLLTNAIKYRSPARPLKINVTTLLNSGNLELKFSDNGLGIDVARYKERIFGLYQRFHSHPDSKGIGLYITYTQMKALGGKISVESKVNSGTTFTLSF